MPGGVRRGLSAYASPDYPAGISFAPPAQLPHRNWLVLPRSRSIYRRGAGRGDKLRPRTLRKIEDRDPVSAANGEARGMIEMIYRLRMLPL